MSRGAPADFLTAVLSVLPPGVDVAVVRDGADWVVAVDPDEVVMGTGEGALKVLEGIDRGWWAGFLGYDLGRAVESVVPRLPDDGGIFSFGTARYYGSTGNINLNRPIVGMSPTTDGKGYWLVADDGGVFAFGNAPFFGSTGNIALNRPIVGMSPTPDGKGYWMVASDGGVFSFGTAGFHGSTGAIVLNRPIVGMSATGDGGGYWMVANDGGVFTFGNAAFHGSAAGSALTQPIVGLTLSGTGNGYYMVAADGKVYPFGDAGAGSTGGLAALEVSERIVSVTGVGYYPPAVRSAGEPDGLQAGVLVMP